MVNRLLIATLEVTSQGTMKMQIVIKKSLKYSNQFKSTKEYRLEFFQQSSFFFNVISPKRNLWMN